MGLQEPYDLAALRDLEVMRKYNPTQRQRVYDELEINVRRIVAIAADAQVKLFLCTSPYNLRLPVWSPSAPALLERHSDRSLEALAKLDDDDSAAAADVLAERLLKRGQTEAAKELFEQALWTTRKPTRATRQTNATIRRVAEDTQTPVIDLKQAIDAMSPDGLPADEVFTDQCHLYPAGNQRLLETMAAALAPALRN